MLSRSSLEQKIPGKLQGSVFVLFCFAFLCVVCVCSYLPPSPPAKVLGPGSQSLIDTARSGNRPGLERAVLPAVLSFPAACIQ